MTDPAKRKERLDRDTKYCEVQDCDTATCGRKNYCPAHLLMNPYVLNLLARIEARGGIKPWSSG